MRIKDHNVEQMTDHLILITCWGPCACSQSSAVLLSHFVAKYYSLLTYTWIRLKINPLVPRSVLNRHVIECGPKLTKVAGHKWSFRAKMTHCTFDNTHIFTTTHTSHADAVSILVGFGFLPKVRRKELWKVSYSLKCANRLPTCVLIHQ